MGYLQTKLKAIIATIDTWKFKSGNLYVMTSNTEPSPFVASGSNINNSAFQAFNNNTGNNVNTVVVNAYREGWAQLLFNQEVKVKKIEIAWSSTTGTRSGIRCQLLVNDVWTNVAGYTGTSQTVNVDNILATGIRFYYNTENNSESHSLSCSKMQVTEWYEQ